MLRTATATAASVRHSGSVFEKQCIKSFRFGLMKHIINHEELLKRSISSSAVVRNDVSLAFTDPYGDRIELKGKEGESVLDVAINNNIDLEGACEGTLACSTCHVIVDPINFKKLDTPQEEELDMLDLAYGLTDRSRLGCQIILRPDLEGIELQLPSTGDDR